MAEAPAYDQFIEFGEAFADINPVAMIALVAVERVNGFGARLKFLFFGGAGGRQGEGGGEPGPVVPRAAGAFAL